MNDETWEAKRLRLSGAARVAAVELLKHIGAASFCIPLNDGVLAAGSREALCELVNAPESEA